MGIEKILTDAHHQILKAEFPAGKVMPVHYSTSDAFLIMTKGKIVIFLENERHQVSTGEYFNIPANKNHYLEVKEDFLAYIVMTPDGEIKYVEQK